MAKLSNINGRFAVEDDGAIQFNGQAGTSGYVLESRGASSPPVWTDRDTGNVTGSGTLNKVPRWTATGSNLGDGPITFATNDSTFAGQVQVNKAKSGTGVENYDLIRLNLSGTGVVGDSSTIGWFSTSGTKTAGIEGISGLDNILYGELAFHVRRYTTDTYDRVMTINNRGNVGIGITSPDTRLHIYGSSTVSEMYLGEDAAVDKAGILKYNQGDGTGTGTVQLGNWGDNLSTTGITIKKGGNVGIGTNSPDALLDLESATPALRITDTDSNAPYELKVDGGTFSIKEVSNSRTLMSMTTGAVITLDSLGSNTVLNTSGSVVVPNGSVGIGTTGPEHALVVIGSIGFGLSYNGGVYANDTVTGVDENWGLEVQRTANVNDYNTRLKYYPASGESRAAGIYDSRNARFSLYSDTNNNPNIIIPNGNVGIGTNIPGAKLSIASGVAKTSTSTPEVLYLGQSNEASNYSTLQVYTKGGASQADRSVIFQTIESGVANAGNIILQPSGGNVGIGTFAPSNKLQIVQGHSILVGDYFQLGSGSSDIMGALGWNRDTTNGVIYNTSFGAFQMHNNQGKLCLQGYNASGANQFQHEFYNNGNIFFTDNLGIGTTVMNGKLSVAADDASSTPPVSSGIYVGPYQGNTAVGSAWSYSNSGNTYTDFSSRYDNSGSYMRFVMKASATPVYAMTIRGDGRVGVIGTFTAAGDVVAYSDKKLKKNIKTLDGSKVYEMRGVSFDRIDTNKASSGVIAQEIQEIAPELVNESDGTLGVAYGNLTGYLIEAIKELKAEIEELKSNKCNCNK